MSAPKDLAVGSGTSIGWSGYLPPINTDGTSIFKLGRTVPVKFRLSDSAAWPVTARLYVSKVSNAVSRTEVEAASTSSANSGNIFRLDPAPGQYIYNLSTSGLGRDLAAAGRPG